MIYVIDHNDSFTHNVVHQFALFDRVECDNYNEISEKKIQQASTIVFSHRGQVVQKIIQKLLKSIKDLRERKR